ncbi:unnamed protein product [Paramecium pentaurelia]|uniref:Uncharacterized protein n=1 Tax=Paramecium pentaurelia TaxID=43138 RepID=A0A8S1YDF2_9CILI|nr:unnamed protein product [Paramecium pentaurelia]
MRKSVELEMNKPLKYPSNDVSVCWPSFQTSNFSSIPIRKDPEINTQMQLSKFSDSGSENNQVPKNLETLCSYQNQRILDKQKSLLFSCEMFLYTKIISFNLMNISLLFLTFYLPYYYFENYEQLIYNNFKKIRSNIFSSSFIFNDIRIIHSIYQISKLIFQRKTLLNIIIKYYNLINLCTLHYNKQHYSIYYFILFIVLKKFKIYLKIAKQMIITKMIIILLFQIHYFTCIWGIELKQSNQEDLIYNEYFYKSFLMFFFQFDQLDNQQNHLIILTHLFSNIIIFIFLFKIFTQYQSQLSKHEINLKTYLLFLKSDMIQFKVKFILFHYSTLFLLIENELSTRQKLKKQNLLQYIKMKLINQELRQFNFLSKKAINEISTKGLFELSLKQQNFQAEINGIYIILTGRVNLEFMGLKLQIDNRKIINICLIEMMNIQQQQRKLKLEPFDMNDILYFYINQDQFQNCLQKETEIEKYQMIKDDINFNNNTELLNIQCYFCNLYHPTFNCGCLNIKRRFTYDKTCQERDSMFKRKKNNRIKAGIYQQITNQGTSNIDVNDISSNSFEAFSDYSSDKVNVSNQQLQFDQIGRQSSISQIYKDILQIDLISDKISDPIISSTLIKHLQVPDTVINQTDFQDQDSILDIDKIWEYQHYKVAYNINNLHKFSNKSVQQIVQELMYDEYLERDNMLRNAFNSSPLKAVKKKIVFSKNIYNNYLQQSPSSITSQNNNQCKVIGVVAIQKKKIPDVITNVSSKECQEGQQTKRIKRIINIRSYGQLNQRQKYFTLDLKVISKEFSVQ